MHCFLTGKETCPNDDKPSPNQSCVPEKKEISPRETVQNMFHYATSLHEPATDIPESISPAGTTQITDAGGENNNSTKGGIADCRFIAR